MGRPRRGRPFCGAHDAETGGAEPMRVSNADQEAFGLLAHGSHSVVPRLAKPSSMRFIQVVTMNWRTGSSGFPLLPARPAANVAE